MKIPSVMSGHIDPSQGSLVAIDLGDEVTAYGRVISKAEVAFYDFFSKGPSKQSVDSVYEKPVAFVVGVMNDAVKSGRWRIVDSRALESKFLGDRKYFVHDALSGNFSIYHSVDGTMSTATKDECQQLECAAIWDAEQIEDRLRDHFAGRENQWVISLRRCLLDGSR